MVSAVQTPTSKLNVQSRLVWLGQIVLAGIFGTLGYFNITDPIERAIEGLGWLSTVPPEVVRIVGVLQIIGAVGVIVPWALRVIPHLTSLAALGLAFLEFLTIEFHLGQGLWGMLPADFALLSLALIIAWARGTHAPTGHVLGW